MDTGQLTHHGHTNIFTKTHQKPSKNPKNPQKPYRKTRVFRKNPLVGGLNRKNPGFLRTLALIVGSHKENKSVVGKMTSGCHGCNSLWHLALSECGSLAKIAK